jgi:hypothetical protein
LNVYTTEAKVKVNRKIHKRNKSYPAHKAELRKRRQRPEKYKESGIKRSSFKGPAKMSVLRIGELRGKAQQG